MPTPTVSVNQLKRAISIAEKIESLQSELATLLGGRTTPAAAPAPVAATAAKTGRRGRRKMSPEARARIVAAQKARWAKFKREKGAKAPVAKAANSGKGKKKRTLTPEGRARLAAAMKARWDAAKRSGGPAPTKTKKKK